MEIDEPVTTISPEMEIDEPTKTKLFVEPEETEEDEPITSSILLKKCLVKTVRRGRPTKAGNKKDLDPNKPTKLQSKDAIEKQDSKLLSLLVLDKKIIPGILKSTK